MVSTITFKQRVAQAIYAGTIDVPSHIAFGSGSVTLDENSTTLSSEVVRNSIGTSTKESQTIEFVSTLTTAQGNGSTITEVGLFDDSTSGDMYAGQTIISFDKTSNFEYDFTFVVRVN